MIPTGTIGYESNGALVGCYCHYCTRKRAGTYIQPMTNSPLGLPPHPPIEAPISVPKDVSLVEILDNKMREVFGQPEKGKQDFNGNIDGVGYKSSMDDLNKPQLTQVWPSFIAGIARVLMHGAKKYARGNWMRGMSYNEVLDAMKRHMAAIERGEEVDKDSGLPHIHHLACGAMFIDFYQNSERKAEYAKFDDRMYKETAPPGITDEF